MQLQDIIDLFTQNKIKKGKMVKVHYITTKGDYSKETETVVRFVKYGNIKGVQPKGNGNSNDNYIIPNALIYNANKQEYYLIMATINTPYKAKVKYFYQGNEIDKATYDNGVPSRPNTQPLVVFKKNIKDIISLG